MDNGRAKIDVTEHFSLQLNWPEMKALEIFNRLVRGVYRGKTTTMRRVWALQIFLRRFSIRMPELVDELHRLWPHWQKPPRGIINLKEEYDWVIELFHHLERAGRPADLDSWRPTTRRSMNVVADTERIVRRFLDPSYAKPERVAQRSKKKCRVHTDKPVAAYGVCATCYQRIIRLRGAGVVTDDTPAALLDKMLAMPVVKGRGSNLLDDARKIASNHREE